MDPSVGLRCHIHLMNDCAIWIDLSIDTSDFLNQEWAIEKSNEDDDNLEASASLTASVTGKDSPELYIHYDQLK